MGNFVSHNNKKCFDWNLLVEEANKNEVCNFLLKSDNQKALYKQQGPTKYRLEHEEWISDSKFLLCGKDGLIDNITIISNTSSKLKLYIHLTDYYHNEKIFCKFLEENNITFSSGAMIDISNSKDAKQFLLMWLKSCDVEFDE